STLLRNLATQEDLAASCGGVAFLPAGGLSGDDILHVLFEVFYDCDVPLKPSPTWVRRLLQDTRAAIVIDDTGLTGGQFRVLVDAAPSCAFVVAADAEANADIRSVRLAGLPLDDARQLFAHGLGRALEPGEFDAADTLCGLADTEPARILRAAVGARESSMSLAEVATAARRSGQAPSPRPADADRRLLASLAAVPGLTLDEGHLTALSGQADVAERLARWVASGVVVAVPGDPVAYRLGRSAADVARWPLVQSRAALRAHFVAWARDRRGAVLRPGVDVEALRLLQADAGRHSEWAIVLALGALLDAAYSASGRWDAWHDVLAAMLSAAQELGDSAAEAMALHQLGTRALCTSDTTTAVDQLGRALEIRERLDDRLGAAATEHNLALVAAPPVVPSPDRRPWWKAPVTALTSAAVVTVLLGAGLLLWLTGSRPSIEFRPVAAAFADQPMNRPGEPQQLGLVNTGRVTLHVTGVRVTGEHAADFSVADTTCVAELAAGQTCTTTIVFTPVDKGARSAALAVDVTELGDEPQLPLSGGGAEPDPASVTVDPAVLMFDGQEVGTRSPDRAVRRPAGSHSEGWS
ncbi:MAG: choice-of-anchor D domain-containing protein, partial [Actinomycetia bacterium]|nr:choice-of-anchor D domain-containing protein [Actinomycetes bacterium]